jgi:hypothetical protein
MFVNLEKNTCSETNRLHKIFRLINFLKFFSIKIGQCNPKTIMETLAILNLCPSLLSKNDSGGNMK